METKQIMRGDVPVNETWDLTLLYPSAEAMFADLDKAKAIAKHIKETYPGKLTSPEVINNCLEEYREFYELVYLCESYSDLAVSTDYYNNELMDINSRVSTLVTRLAGDLSFIESEISECDESVLLKAKDIATNCKGYIAEIIRFKPHKLHKEAERVLAATGQSMRTPYEVYNSSKLADMKFDSFTVKGSTYPLGYALYEDNYAYSADTEVRRKAFEIFSKKLRDYENTTATAYNAYVTNEKVISELRGYENIFAKDLFEDKVNEELYNRQIDVIMDKLAPHMRKYAALLGRVHKLDQVTYADLKLPLDPDYCPSITIEGSRDYIEKGLALMGEDYRDMIRRAYEERWIDFAKNQGKSTGGFCASPYGKNSFILLSFNNKMSDVFTLAHELGHAGNFMLANAAHSIFDTNISGYFGEAPSTMNEILLAHYMLRTSDDKRFRRFVLSNMVGNTYYHNFVTHLLEAYYQREVYRIIDKGGSVQAPVLSKLMHDTLERFWGDAVLLTEGAELTWMRQPHYYMGLYSYSYSAGLTIATQMAKRIENEGAPAVEDWKKVLTAGATLDPIDLAALGGIDITTDEALLDTIEIIGSYIDELIRLTDELEEEKN